MKILLIFTGFLMASFLHSQSITYNYQVNWQEQVSGVTSRLNCIAAFQSGDNILYACGVNGVVIHTTNKGENWNLIRSNGLPLEIDLKTLIVTSNNVLLTAGNIGNTAYIYRTENNGQNWSMVFSQVNGKINSLNKPDLSNLIFMQGNPVGGRWSLWKSTDNGITWDSTGMYLPQLDGEEGFENSFTYYYNNSRPDNILFGTNKQRIYHSPDGGLNWSAIPTPNENTYSVASIGRYILTGGSNMFSSSNTGSPWEYEASLGTGNINGIILSGLIIITPFDNIMTVPVFYIRSDNKIYYTDNGGGSDWEIKYTAANGTYTNIFYKYNSVWALRDNGGITRGDIDMITSVTPDNYPYSFELKQNFPNPFNPKTTIPITLHRSTHISLKIYNSAGELGATLLDGQQNLLFYDNIPYGYTYLVAWDASAFPSGVYYYQVISDDYKETRKMMLVK